jgi:crotonobetainyl-CoA:carnitine CoA-transferase CaiB-like acyl-CoA transferase
VRVPAGMGDHASAMGFYSAIISALYKRERTGLGSHVGSSLLMNGIWANSCLIQTAIYGEEIARPDDREQDPMPWRNSYRCSDGKWLLLSIVHSDPRWDVFKGVVASPLLDDIRFQTVADRKRHPVELTAVLDQIFATKTAAEWADILDRHGVVFGAVTRVIDVPDDKQARLAGAIVPTEDGTALTISSPFWIEGVEKTKAKPAPTLGQHTDEVLSAAGLGADEIKKLRSEGVIR